MRAWRFTLFPVLITAALASGEEPLFVAVASNFQQTARELATLFEEETGQPVRISAGATGKLYGQIVNGAPFDVFLAADAERPALLEASGHAAVGTRRTYATGSLLLWSRDPGMQGQDCRAQLERLGRAKLAIANPLTAPYGRAAKEFLVNEGLWDDVSRSVVMGENISQAMQFAATGNARFGLVAAAQASSDLLPEASCAWPVPVDTHAPIRQQAVVIAASGRQDVALRFIDFLQSDSARRLIESSGYLPEASR